MTVEGGTQGSETQPLAEGPPPLQDGARGGVGNAELGEAAGLFQAPRNQENTSMKEDQHRARRKEPKKRRKSNIKWSTPLKDSSCGVLPSFAPRPFGVTSEEVENDKIGYDKVHSGKKKRRDKRLEYRSQEIYAIQDI